MHSGHFGRSVSTSIAFFVLIAGSFTAFAREPALQLTLRRAQKAQQFLLEIRNAAPRALALNLGTVEENGRLLHPYRIHLLLTGPGRKSLPLELLVGGIATGRSDPMVELLPAGASFILPIDLKDYFSPRNKIWELKLASGQYALRAEYTGGPPYRSELNSDLAGLAFLPYWVGTADSRSVPFVVLSKPRMPTKPRE